MVKKKWSKRSGKKKDGQIRIVVKRVARLQLAEDEPEDARRGAHHDDAVDLHKYITR